MGELTFGYGCMFERHLSDNPEQALAVEGYAVRLVKTRSLAVVTAEAGSEKRVALTPQGWVGRLFLISDSVLPSPYQMSLPFNLMRSWRNFFSDGQTYTLDLLLNV